MAVMAHADDLELYAGGTMAKFTDQGYEGILVMVTANIDGGKIGNKSYRQTTPEEVAPVRAAETEKGAAILGVRIIENLKLQNLCYSNGKGFVTIGDPDFNYCRADTGALLAAAAMNERLLQPLIDLYARYEPEIVVMQNMNSGFEHLCAGHIAHLAFRKAMAQGASLGQLWLPMALRPTAWASDLRLYASPNILIDITRHWDRKVAAILAHQSQQLESHVEGVRTINRYWGMARECELAEPFFTLCEAHYR